MPTFTMFMAENSPRRTIEGGKGQRTAMTARLATVPPRANARRFTTSHHNALCFEGVSEPLPASVRLASVKRGAIAGVCKWLCSRALRNLFVFYRIGLATGTASCLQVI